VSACTYCRQNVTERCGLAAHLRAAAIYKIQHGLRASARDPVEQTGEGTQRQI